ncbi:MAG: molybdate ABC transporter permease subunit [Gemmatimonadales bacterium]|nr:molybdate ABC transporter permease subunit [Gemmatimonadales bacterium]
MPAWSTCPTPPVRWRGTCGCSPYPSRRTCGPTIPWPSCAPPRRRWRRVPLPASSSDLKAKASSGGTGSFRWRCNRVWPSLLARAELRYPGAEAALRLAGSLATGVLLVLLALPLVALLLHVKAEQLLRRLADPAVLESLRLSLVTSTAAAAAVVTLGLPVAYLLAGPSFRGKRLVEVLVDLPMVLPPTVAGFLLLLAFGRAGLGGRALAAFGLSLPFTTLAVVVAQVFMSAPFFINAARAGFASVDRRYREAAATLRAPASVVFLRVMVPLSLPSLIAGAGMSWARALGEFGATITFAGNLPGRTQTMPLGVYVALQQDLELAVTLSLILVVMSVALLLGLRSLPGILPGAPLARTPGR